MFMNLVLYGSTKDIRPDIYCGKCLCIWLCLNQIIKECIPSLFLGCYVMYFENLKTNIVSTDHKYSYIERQIWKAVGIYWSKRLFYLYVYLQ